MPHNSAKRVAGQQPSPALLAARQYVRLGWHVYPVRAGTRVPVLDEKTTGRKRGASNDPAVVESMFSRYPLADIGVVTGAVSGIWVLDLDNKDSKNGSAAFDALQLGHRDSRGLRVNLPRTARAATPSGGVHYYFKHPGRHVRTTASKLGPGIDVLGDNFQAIAPPSRGRSWVVGGVSRIAAAPPWLISLVCEERRSPAPRQHQRASAEPQEYAGPALSGETLALMTKSAGRGLSQDPEDLQLPEDTELKIQFALTVIPAQFYHEWMRIGGMIACALRGVADDDGRGLWEEWSGDRSDKTNKCDDRRWAECMRYTAFNPDGRSIFKLADTADPGLTWRREYQVALIEMYKRGRV